MGETVVLQFDESGNLGTKGRHFVISCIECNDKSNKHLKNVIKKANLKTKNTFMNYKKHKEIKASDSNPVIKDYFLRKIANTDTHIHYIVADLVHVQQRLKDDENIFYNFLLKFLVVPVAKRKEVEKIVIRLDKRTIKVKSGNSFYDYIRIHLNGELELDVDLLVEYVESHNSYCIQAADFIANAIYTKYEYGKTDFYDLFAHKITHRELFPIGRFGEPKVLPLTGTK